MIVPGLLFGTLAVLAPLRMDELGRRRRGDRRLLPRRRRRSRRSSPRSSGRISDRRGRRAPALAGLAAGAVVMALLPVADARPGSSAC